MGALALAVIVYVRAFVVPRHKLALEAAAHRQQLVVFKRKQARPKLHRLDRLFWRAGPTSDSRRKRRHTV